MNRPASHALAITKVQGYTVDPIRVDNQRYLFGASPVAKYYVEFGLVRILLEILVWCSLDSQTLCSSRHAVNAPYDNGNREF